MARNERFLFGFVQAMILVRYKTSFFYYSLVSMYKLWKSENANIGVITCYSNKEVFFKHQKKRKKKS